MFVYLIAMIAILAVAAAVAGLVMVGIEGRGRARMPRIAARLSEAAKHLNGEETSASDAATAPPHTHRGHHEQTPLGR